MLRASRPLTLIVSLIVGFALLAGCVAPSAPPAAPAEPAATQPPAPAADPMADLIKDVNSELLISRSNTDPSIKARLNIILDTNQWITYTRLREIVSQYQELGKSLYGWASFLIPELDCLTLEYTEAEDPGSTAELRSSQGQVKLIPNRFKRIHINLADAPVDLLLTRVPAWAWGCKYARWSGDK